jgi:hypothetical protein
MQVTKPTLDVTQFGKDDSELKTQLQKNTYEYFLAKLVHWYMAEKGLFNTGAFNDNNDFDLTKLSLLPFFTCTANGSLEEIYSFYGNFYALSEGPICGIALYHLHNNDLNYFSIESDDTNGKLKVKNSIEINQLIHQIETAEIGGVEFSNYLLKSKKLIDAINSAINSLKVKTDNKFAIYSQKDLRFIARQHLSWENTISGQREKSKRDNKPIDFNDLIIKLEDVKADKKVYNPIESEEATVA